MWEIHWLGLGVLATLGAACWAVVLPEKRVYLTAGISTIGYLTMALTAPGVERMTQTGETVAAPVSVEVQMVVGLLAIISLVVIFLFRLGEYPPPEEQIES